MEIHYATTAFEAFTEVPRSVALLHVGRLHDACYDQSQTFIEGAEEVAEEVAEAAEAACSGEGSTVIGWKDYIVVLGTPYPVVPSPASSDFVVTTKDLVIGHVRSSLDDITLGGYAGSQQVGTWLFGPVPMFGSFSADPNCLGPILVSTHTSVSGVPLGVPVMREVLKVAASGTTCLIPC
jgi:hypothetical protein